MSIINLCPHDVSICDEDGNIIKTYHKSGKAARISHGYRDAGKDVDGVPILVRPKGRVTNLPKPKEGTYYIVSNIVYDYCTDRTDLLAPVRQVKKYGQVVGCRAFIGR